jgi:curved DNA-binding protein CbpA
MSAYPKNGSSKIDFYKLLRVSPSSTTQEIKKAYYKLALQSHPDKHNGCTVKLENFKRINEAYDILSNPTTRSEYDRKIGNIYHSSFSHTTTTYKRKTPIPKDYRKVYTSRPPPNWKTTWDHAKHYEMHYGDGFQKEAMAQAVKTAEKEGAYIYRSPIGKGFTFDHLNASTAADQTNDAKCGATTTSMNYNPFSKRTVQGPPKVVFDYQEVSNFSGKEQILKHERMVYDIHLRRYRRCEEAAQNNESYAERPTSEQGKTEEETPPTSHATIKKSSIYSRYENSDNNLKNDISGITGTSSCIIM